MRKKNSSVSHRKFERSATWCKWQVSSRIIQVWTQVAVFSAVLELHSFVLMSWASHFQTWWNAAPCVGLGCAVVAPTCFFFEFLCWMEESPRSAITWISILFPVCMWMTAWNSFALASNSDTQESVSLFTVHVAPEYRINSKGGFYSNCYKPR